MCTQEQSDSGFRTAANTVFGYAMYFCLFLEIVLETVFPVFSKHPHHGRLLEML